MSLMAAMVLLAAAPAAVVVRPVANMYSAPAEDSDVVSQAILGSNVELARELAGWFRVVTADRYSGWMPASSLRRLKPSESPYASSGRTAQVDGLFAHLYREPDVAEHQPLMTAPFEARLEVAAEPESGNRRWLQVRLPDGRYAWLQRGDVSIGAGLLDVQGMIALAKRFVGLPYLWGGTSTFGYDCSGFTQMLLKRRGILIPRDAGPQMRWEGFVPVGRGKLRPGDLLFFGPSAEKVTHTGMYIGRGEFINATTWLRPVVQVSKLDDPHWSEILVGCRRPK